MYLEFLLFQLTLHRFAFLGHGLLQNLFLLLLELLEHGLVFALVLFDLGRRTHIEGVRQVLLRLFNLHECARSKATKRGLHETLRLAYTLTHTHTQSHTQSHTHLAHAYLVVEVLQLFAKLFRATLAVVHALALRMIEIYVRPM